MEKRTFIVIEYYEADALIEGIYGVDRNSYQSAAMEQRNDTMYRITCGERFVTDKNGNPMEINHVEWSSANITDFLNGEDTYVSTQDFLSELAYFGIIESGEYLVEVSW